MQSEPHDWTVPAPLRALLWWPPVALVVAMIAPAAAPVTIAAAGAALAALGVLASAVARRLGGGAGDLLEAADLGESGPRLAMAGDPAPSGAVDQRAA